MKAILIATAIVAAVGIAIVQHSRLSELHAETATLEAGRTTSAMKGDGRSRLATATQREATVAQIEFVHETMIEVMVAYHYRSEHHDQERMKQLFLAAMDFSGRDIARLVELLRDDPRLAGAEADEIADFCRHIFSEAAPFGLKDYLLANRDLPDWQNLFDSAFRNCLHADGRRAIKTFEEESARGNRDYATTAIRASVLLELAVSDPDKMLALAVSPEFSADPDALFKLGGFTANRIDNPSDHQRYLSAMWRAQERNPSPLLDEIRQDYVSGMGQRLYQWPAADAISLIDSGFTADERFSIVDTLARRGDLNDPGKWFDWFLRIDPKEWTAWTQREGVRDQHPLVTQIESRSIYDPQSSGGWLGKIPPGALRDEATLSYAWMIADRDPDRAAGYLAELPESKGKQNLVQRIENARNSEN